MNRIQDKSPIIITGCARSGASMVAGVLIKCGAFGGDMNNQFENQKIHNEIVPEYLSSEKVDPEGQNPLAGTKELFIPQYWRSQVESTFVQEGYTGGEWIYKGSTACQIWPVWNHAFPNAKWIVVRRNSFDIAQSCMSTGFMKAYNTHEGWIGWINEHERKWVEMINAGLNVKFVWPERMIKGNYEQLFEIVEWLGLSWKSKEVLDFIDPKLWKARKKAGIKQ